MRVFREALEKNKISVDDRFKMTMVKLLLIIFQRERCDASSQQEEHNWQGNLVASICLQDNPVNNKKF